MTLPDSAAALPTIETPWGPLPVTQVFGIGQNYAKHAREMGGTPPERPVVFAKNVASVSRSGAAIVIPKICRQPEQVDFEGELALVIGRAARNVPEAAALSYLLGYAAANDVSARWWQKQGSGGQFCRGKGFDTFCPLSPLVPAASVNDPQTLRIVTRVNGAVMQDATTDDMIFSCARLISELSTSTTLLPGTVILTGTPSGVGTARTPPVYLRPGDTVEVELPGLALLRNTVAAEPD